jgi:prevent-host-death family protein
MTQVTVHQAKTHLSKLINKALEGEEVVIAKRDKPVVRLAVVRPEKGSRQIGWGKGLVTYIAPDFDEPLDDFAEYTETAEEEQARLSRGKNSGRRSK